MLSIDTQIEQIRRLLSGNLPGMQAQAMMSPSGPNSARYYQAPNDANPACVLILLHRKSIGWHTTFMKRTSHELDKHAGQISFPGGKKEDHDASFVDCALRETEEELGIERNHIEVIGKLSDLYVFASNFMVYPFVGIIDSEPIYDIDPREVEQVLEVPLNYFNQNIIKKTDVTVRGMNIKNVPYYDLFGEVLWGATAMMMSEFLNIWKRSDAP